MKTVSSKTNFTSGQITPQLFGRGDLTTFENGARKLQNVTIHPTGGVSRRYGTRYIDSFDRMARLIPFEFNTEQTYLLCFLHQQVKVYENGRCICTLEAPWTSSQLYEFNFTQSADTLLVVHPDVPSKQINRLSATEWSITDWYYYVAPSTSSESGMICCPYFNFYQNQVSFHFTDALYGNMVIESNRAIFDSSYMNILIKFHNGLMRITEIVNASRVNGIILKSPSKWDDTTDWQEPAFSYKRGWPASVTFHQGRLVIGGSKSLPNRLWLSRSSDLFNFSLGKGLDDDAIEFSILSDQVNAIKAVLSSRHLLVFTTGAEWMVSGEPLAPASIQLNRQTVVGSYGKYSLIPQQVDGATLFISRSGNQLREFLYTDVEQAYMANDLTLLSGDIITKPIDACFNPHNNVLYITSEDGTISCLTTYRTEQVNGWSKMITKGKFISVAVSGNDLYMLVQRGDKYFLEVMDESLFIDCGKKLSAATPQKVWTGLEHLEGQEVAVVADGYNAGKYTVTNGTIELLNAASNISVGLPYEHIIEPLPYMVENELKPYPPKAYRVIAGTFRILNSSSFKLDIGNGYFEVPLRRMSDNQILDADKIQYSGDITLRSIGWTRDMNKNPWSIKSDEPSAFSLLSVTTQIKIK